MKNQITSFISNQKQHFKNNKLKCILMCLCWLFYSLLVLTLQLFTSMEGMSKIPIVFTICLAISVIIYIFLYGQFKFNLMIIGLIFYVIYGFIITAIQSRIFFPYQLTTLNVMLMCVILFWFFDTFKHLKLQLILFVISSVILMLVFSYYYKDQLFSFSEVNTERIGSKFGNVNDAGKTFALGILIAGLYSIFYFKKRNFFFLIPFWAISMFLIVKTGSRTSFIVGSLSIIVTVTKMLCDRNKIGLIIFYVFFAAGITLVFTLPAFSYFVKRFLAVFDLLATGDSSEASANIRLSLQINGYHLWLKNIFFGYGSEGFKWRTNQPYYSHATLCELLTNFGLIGFFLFFGAMIYYLFIGKKNSNSFVFLIIFFISFIIPHFFLGTIQYTKQYYLFIALIASLFNDENMEKDTFFTFSFNRKIKAFQIRFYRGVLLR